MMKKKGYAKGGMKKKGYAKGGMPMTKVNGMSVPKFAADGKGANDMKKGGMMKKKGYSKGGSAAGMTLAKIRSAAKSKGYKLVKMS